MTLRRCLPTLGTLALAFTVELAPAAASAQRDAGDDRLPLGDLIEIVALDGELLAVDAQGGGTTRVRLRLGERVLWRSVKGLVGVAITDQRVLAVATDSASWQEAVYEQSESPPADGAVLGDRVALVVLEQRVLGFVGRVGRFVEIRLGPQESLRASRVGANVAVVVTDRKAHGLSYEAGGFFPVRLQLKERIEDVGASANFATVRTNQRVLVFRAPTGSWAERRH